MMKKTVDIEGMTCQSCVQRVEKAVKKLPGVKMINVNLITEKIAIEYDPKLVQIEEVIETMAKIGYKGKVLETQKKVVIPIEGMTCASCAQKIEKALAKCEGIITAGVNLATEKATISYDGDIIKLQEIKAVITKIGYTPRLIETEENVEDASLKKEKELKILRTKLVVAAIFCIPLFYIAMAPMITWVSLPMPQFLLPMEHMSRYAIVELLLTIPIIAAGYRFYTVGFKALFSGSPNMDSLIAIGTTAALVFSVYSTYEIITLADSHLAMAAMDGLYYESAGVIITLILLGKYLEAISKGKTSEAIKKLMGLAPKTATVLIAGQAQQIPIGEVETGQIILVKPGEKIPVDGVIIEGQSAIDEAMLTGESMPVSKKIGDNVYAASINKNGSLQFEATKVGKDTALAQIIKLVEDAQGSKAPIAKMADIVSGYFVPIVVVIAVIVGIMWYLATLDLGFSLKIFITILVIACPCALGLATPTAIMVGTGKGAENGILIKGGAALEQAHRVQTVIFDKTGTITAGKPEVTDIIALNGITEDELLQQAAAAEQNSEHPLGEAIVKRAVEKQLVLAKLEYFMAIPGHGIHVKINDKDILIGNSKMMQDNNIGIESLQETSNKLADEGKTPMYIAIAGNIAGIIAVADVVKASSRVAIEELQAMGINVAMITGDNAKTANAIARQVGITRIIAEVLPEDKAIEIKKLQQEGQIVAMVGDGLNDAPALAVADVGIAIGTGTDVAIESADIILMRSDLEDVAKAIKLSKKTIKNIKQNLFWAFGYNAAGIPLAAGLLYLFGGPLLNPVFAAAAMAFSSVSVLLNALRLKGTKL
ncbi:MAG: heavy metal translocating P-type ATPase [Culicoidibacterales bacterium]